jgi:hypothetical protein
MSKRKRQRRITPRTHTKEKITVPIKKSKWRIAKLIYWLLGAIGLAITLWSAYPLIHNVITPKEQLWKESNYALGVHIPESILYSYDTLKISLGGIAVEVPLSILQSDEGYQPANGIQNNGKQPYDYRFKLINNNLYVSASFNDIDENYLGQMDFNSFELQNSEISHYHDGNDNMEIIDKKGLVVFNMQYKLPNTVVIQGYSIQNGGITIINTEGVSFYSTTLKDYKNVVVPEIRKIKPLNKY